MPLVQLLDAKTLKPGDVLAAGGTLTYGQMATPGGPARRSRGTPTSPSPSKDYIVPRDASGRLAGADDVRRRRARRRPGRRRPTRSATRTSSCPRSCARAPNPDDYGNAIAEYAAVLRPRRRRACSPTTPTWPRPRATTSDGARPKAHNRSGHSSQRRVTNRRRRAAAPPSGAAALGVPRSEPESRLSPPGRRARCPGRAARAASPRARPGVARIPAYVRPAVATAAGIERVAPVDHRRPAHPGGHRHAASRAAGTPATR